MGKAELCPSSVFTPRAYQRAALADRARFQAWMWSRQTGKGFTAALKVNDYILDVEARRERVDVMLLSRSLLASRNLARKVGAIGESVCRARKLLQGVQLDDFGRGQFELKYPGDSRVYVLSSNPDAAAGFTGPVVIDEIDLHKRAHDLLGNTLPVVSTRGYWLLVTSTPRGQRVMYQIAREAEKPESVWSFRKLTIFEAVAQGCDQDPAVLRRAILDELKWRQEYLCEFVDEDTCWIPWELLVAGTSDVATVEAPVLLPGDVYAGWDVSRWHDLSVLWIVNKFGPVLITRGVVIMQRLPFDAQIKLVCSTLRRYPGFRRLCVDATGIGEMPAETAARALGAYRVEPVKFTGQVKETLAADLRRVLEERNFRLPDDDAVRADFHSVRRTVTAAGNPRFEGETPGSHADRFWAGALAVHAALPAATPFVFTSRG